VKTYGPYRLKELGVQRGSGYPAFVGCISGLGGNLRGLKAPILQDPLQGSLDTDTVVVDVDPLRAAHGGELESPQPWPISELQGLPPTHAPADFIRGDLGDAKWRNLENRGQVSIPTPHPR
jgi:hypothetical protein